MYMNVGASISVPVRSGGDLLLWRVDNCDKSGRVQGHPHMDASIIRVGNGQERYIRYFIRNPAIYALCREGLAVEWFLVTAINDTTAITHLDADLVGNLRAEFAAGVTLEGIHEIMTRLVDNDNKGTG